MDEILHASMDTTLFFFFFRRRPVAAAIDDVLLMCYFSTGPGQPPYARTACTAPSSSHRHAAIKQRL